MKNLTVIDTQRLRLRKPAAADIPRIVQYANNKNVTDMTLSMPYPYNADAAISWINMGNEGMKDESHIIYAIAELPDDTFIGGIGLRVTKRFNRAELGFWLGEPYWGNGYMSEAAETVIRFGFDKLNLHKIVAHHLPDNPASARVLQKNGLVYEGNLKDHVRKNGKYLSLVQYRITRPEYELLS